MGHSQQAPHAGLLQEIREGTVSVIGIRTSGCHVHTSPVRRTCTPQQAPKSLHTEVRLRPIAMIPSNPTAPVVVSRQGRGILVLCWFRARRLTGGRRGNIRRIPTPPSREGNPESDSIEIATHRRPIMVRYALCASRDLARLRQAWLPQCMSLRQRTISPITISGDCSAFNVIRVGDLTVQCLLFVL